MSDIIQLLPDHVANQIAAGEVVQRPASVVKELLENAIDSGATEISLIIKEAGKTLIQVVDNGKGMSVTDARLCFERHATSKIKTADDLFNLTTKGFRGEALASIAAIAHIEMRTKPESDDLGTHIKIAGSEVVIQEPCATPKGTSIWVKNLFFNVPARRNFLKSNPVELRHVIDEFHRVAMVHSAIKFEMYSDGSELFKLPVSNIRKRLVHIFGGKTNEKLVPVEEATEILDIKGFVGKPEFAKKTRGEQFFFVNDRFVKSPYLHHAVMSAFEGLLQPKTHPSYYLYLRVDPKSIDINIHPTKTEVKFDNEQALYAIIRATIKHGLGQFNVTPVLDFDRESSMDVPYEYKDKAIQTPQVTVDRSFNPFKTESDSLGSNVSQHTSKASSQQTFSSSFNSGYKKAPQAQWESLYNGLSASDSNSEDVTLKSNLEFESVANAEKLFADHDTEVLTQGVYQLHKKYLVTTIKSGLVIIHQNRAHQRILYEDFRKQISQSNSISQQLLFPLQLSFSKNEVAVLKALKNELIFAGFGFESFNDESIAVNGIPTVVNESEVPIILEQLLADIELEVPESNFSQLEVLSKSLAKTAAVKTGNSLTSEMQQHLVDQLFACEEPNRSPSGKNTFATISVDELDRKF